MGRLSGKIALITGAASVPGIGSATAIRFAQEGARLFLTDINAPGCEAVAESIRSSGGEAVSVGHDVTSSPEWDSVFAAAEAHYGRLDIMVNNAGIAVLGPFAEISEANWIRQNDTNLHSVFYGTQRAVKLMRKAGQGHSAVIHSRNEGHILAFASGVPALRVAVNVGASLGASG